MPLFRRRDPRARLGARAERIAAGYLRRAGYRILARNVRYGRDEADIIARDPANGDIVLVEVRARRDGLRNPESTIVGRKRRAMRRLLGHVARDARARHATRVRFDLVTVDWRERRRPEVRHEAAVPLGYGP